MSTSSLEPEDLPISTGDPSSPPISSTPLSGSTAHTDAECAADTIGIASSAIEPAVEAWSLIALLPFDGQEPPADVTEELARAVWCAVSALWHPSLLARASGLPRIESVDSPSVPGPREIRVVPSGAQHRLPAGYNAQTDDASSTILESGVDRAELIGRIQSRLGADGVLETIENEGMKNSARDFLAIGTVHWILRDLSVAMGHGDGLDHESLTRELLAGAHAWQIGDWASAVNRLRAGFEVLTQARERFYPVDTYLIDLCLLTSSMPEGVLADVLANPVAISLIAQAQAIENHALRDPQRQAALCQAISDGWADVVGGTYSESEDAILPIESVLWQFRRGSEVFHQYLDDRSVETYARRRFGLYPQLPQIAKRFGFRYALHMGFDAGRFPIRPETKRLWESPDGSSLETLVRPPIAADKPSHGWFFAWKLAATMKNDHVAAIPMVHWPSPVAPWYLDLRRTAGYSPVLGRWTTLNDFFHLTDRPYEMMRTEPDHYQSPYLVQAVMQRQADPIGRITRHHRLRARFEATSALQAVARAIASSAQKTAMTNDGTDEIPAFAEIETLIETDRHDEAATAIDRSLPFWAGSLARGIMDVSPVAEAPKAPCPGYLVLNPLNVPRRVAVVLPDAALDLRPGGPLRAAQFTDEGVWAVIDLPPFGFAWVPKETDLSRPPASSHALSTRGRHLSNESMSIEIDAVTGGLRSIAGASEPTARLGQQLVMTGLSDSQGKAVTSQMRCDRFEVDYGGPALAQATATGGLFHPEQGTRLASFTERFRLWTGRPILEIEITLADLDPAWLASAAQADPWSVYLACRWAWPDPNSMLRRSIFWSPELTDAERPETPEAIDISTRTRRTAMLFGGLPYHQKRGNRMLDTLLVAGLESTRSFTLGVVLDLEYPFHAAQDLISPALVVATDDGPPLAGATGWLAQVDHKGVAVSHVEFVNETSDGRGWGLIFHLLETAGHSARCRLRLFRDPSWARQTDFLGETIMELSTFGDAVSIDLTPRELARIEVTLG